MQRKNKNLILLAIVILIGILIYWWVTDFSEKVGNSKPYSSYISSPSINVAKDKKVFIAAYLSTDKTNYSANGKESYTIGQVWIEQNLNNGSEHPETANFENILTVYFDRLTKNDLHEFRLLEKDIYGYKLTGQRAHPDGYPRVRFLLNDAPDTLSLEVFERNPKDSLAWLTEKVIDTLYFTKEK